VDADAGPIERGFVMRDLPERPSLEHYRREAKQLVRAHRGGDDAVHARATAALGRHERFVLADAQLVLAREHGFRSWADLRRIVETSPLDRLAEEERGEVVVDSGLAYGDGEPVRILVRKRLHRYTLSDRGRAIEKAGKPPGWREAAELAVEPMNIDRQGVVFVPTVAGRHLPGIVERLADASRAVHEAVIVLVE
jgi:hypothetical protein